jgi:aldehyde dehydrogenase (NAD+)
MNKTRVRIRKIYQKQQTKRWELALTNAAQRIEKLTRLKDTLMDRRAAMHQALLDDFGKHPAESDLSELLPTIAEIKHTIRNLTKWMKPKKVKTPKVLMGTQSHIRYEAKGLVLILSPWNYPINLLLNPLISSIAAGNCSMVKPSSKVPHTAGFIESLLSDLYPEDEVAVFNGNSQVSNELLELRFDHIFFTGSLRVGRQVMEKAAKHLTPLTLELGGKSPVVVDQTANVQKAAERIMWGKFINAGQTCVAPDYLLIHKDQLAPFLARAKKVLMQRYGVNEQARRKNPSYCRLVSQAHLQTMQKLLETAVRQGASIEFGGQTEPDQRYMEPTLLTGIDKNSALMQAEIFGPILPILTFEHLDEPIHIIQTKETPLALYVFSNSKTNIEKLFKNTTSGGSCINTTLIHLINPHLPFGGVGQSGLGSYHGFFGFCNLSHERAVLRQGRWDFLRWFYPPYTKKTKGLIQKAITYLT